MRREVSPGKRTPLIAPKRNTHLVGLVVQIVIGISVGGCADYFLQDAGFDVLMRVKVIHLADAFSGIYLPDPPQQILDCGVFVFLTMSLMCLRRWSRFLPFANASLVTHCLVGGLYTLLRLALD